MHNLDDLLKILKKLLSANPEIKAAMIVSIEGLPIVSGLAQDMDNMTATLLSLAERSVIEMEKGEFEQMYISGSEGYLIVSQNVGLVPISKKARLGLISLELERNYEHFDRPREIGVERMKPEDIPDKEKLEDMGLTIVSALPEGIDETRMGTITAALFSLAKRAIIQTEKGEFEQLYIRGSKGYLLILSTETNTLLAVSTTKNIRLGLIFMDCKKAAEKISRFSSLL